MNLEGNRWKLRRPNQKGEVVTTAEAIPNSEAVSTVVRVVTLKNIIREMGLVGK